MAESIYERMNKGEWINRLEDEEYRTVAAEEMLGSRRICLHINQALPSSLEERALLEELFEGRSPASSNIFSPMR